MIDYVNEYGLNDQGQLEIGTSNGGEIYIKLDKLAAEQPNCMADEPKICAYENIHNQAIHQHIEL